MRTHEAQRLKLTCLSTFSGLGGMDLGIEAAGFEHVGCVEWDECARRSLKANRGDRWTILEPGDIAALASDLRAEDLGLSIGDLDLLAGAPPCQPYSKAAQWTANSRRGLSDRRAQYLDDLLAMTERLLPKVVLLENVSGFVLGKTSALPHIRQRLGRISAAAGVDYQLDHAIVDAADFGVPQRRKRAILVMTRLPRRFVFPCPTHLDEHTTAWDAIGEEEFDEPISRGAGKWAALLPSIPEGCNYQWHTARGGGEQLFGYRTRYWSFLLKLAKAEPSWTLPAQPGPATGPFHWDNRPLRIQEMLRLQTLPKSWIVEGRSRVDRVKQVGNATPALLAEVVARSVRAHLRNEHEDASVPRLAIDRQRRVPPPRRATAVPDAFRSLIGSHADHPGAGRGPGNDASNR